MPKSVMRAERDVPELGIRVGDFVVIDPDSSPPISRLTDLDLDAAAVIARELEAFTTLSGEPLEQLRDIESSRR